MLIQDSVDLPSELAVSLSLPTMGPHLACTCRGFTARAGEKAGRAGRHSNLPLHLQNATKKHVLTWEEGLVNGCHLGDPSLRRWDQHRHSH